MEPDRRGDALQRSGCILIVDEQEPERTALAAALRSLGRSLVEVASAEAALEASEQQRPVAAVTEVLLPGTSGYELCRALKERHGEDLPVILVSGRRRQPADRVAGLLIGADDYLLKPVHPAELRVRVERLVHRAAPANAGRARLTTREQEVLQLLTDGLQQPEIADRLVITSRTVAKHIEHILAKLDVHTRAQAIGLALREELVTTHRRSHHRTV